MDDGVSIPVNGGWLKGCLVLLKPSGPCFGLTKHRATTQNTRTATSTMTIMATINSGLSVIGVSSSGGNSVEPMVGIITVVLVVETGTAVVVGFSDNIVVVVSTILSAYIQTVKCNSVA